MTSGRLALTSAEVTDMELKRQQSGAELARAAKQQRAASSSKKHTSVNRKRGASRTQEAAESTEVERQPAKQWRPSSALPQLSKPVGFHIEYVRRDDRNRGDHANLLAHIQSGWEVAPRKLWPRLSLPTQRLSEFGECIGNADSILMMISDEMYAQRKRFYNGMRDATTRSIGKPNPRPEGVSHPDMPIVEDRVKFTTTTHNNARARRMPTRVADDT
jgi:hypothetical protein